jgi:CubicO group peptidase (beta-lactamase class C family)
MGTRDSAGTPLQPDNLSFVWSTSKGITATAIHILAERGQLQYDDAIADYWPAFARNGKDAISIRHLMSHTAGIYPNPVLNGYEELYDYETVCTAIAAMTPLHQPGQSHIYHPLTYGWPLAKVVEAITGMPFGAFIQKEISAPLGITDLFIGLPASRQADVARTSIDVDPAILQATPDNPLPDPSIMANDPAIWPPACLPPTCSPARGQWHASMPRCSPAASMACRCCPNARSPTPPASNAGWSMLSPSTKRVTAWVLPSAKQLPTMAHYPLRSGIVATAAVRASPIRNTAWPLQ